jgi:hypothetical protein
VDPREEIFYGLPPRLVMLLSTLFLFDGEEDLDLIQYLADDDALALEERAQKLGEMDSDKRAALVAREIRRQLQFAGLAGLEAIDPTWLLSGVRGEQPVTIGIILSQLSSTARSKILGQLPSEVRARIPPKEDLKHVRMDVIRIVRQKFESKFVTMPAPPGEPTYFYFRDIALLEARDLVQLIRALGIDHLAAAFLPAGRRKLAELCVRLHEQAARELIGAVRETEERDAMSITEANEFLSRLLLGIKNEKAEEDTESFQRELFQKAGLARLALALRLERPTFVQQLAQRLPRGHGQLLKNYVYRLTATPDVDEGRVRRLQDLVLQRVEKLAGRGKVNPRYLKFTFCFWGEDEEDPEAEAS